MRGPLTQRQANALTVGVLPGSFGGLLLATGSPITGMLVFAGALIAAAAYRYRDRTADGPDESEAVCFAMSAIAAGAIVFAAISVLSQSGGLPRAVGLVALSVFAIDTWARRWFVRGREQ